MIYGVVLAGGEVLEQRDANGTYQGRYFNTFGGDSSVTINADDQILIGTDIGAGALIDLVGGDDPATGSQYAGKGIVLLGSANLETWADDAQINLNAPGPVDILAAGYSDEIWAAGWAPNAEGQLSETPGDEVTLMIQVDKVDFVIEASVSVPADATNAGIADLRDDVQAALNTATWTVISNNGDAGAPAVGSQFTDFAADPDISDLPVIDMSLRDGKLLLTSSFAFTILGSSVNADQLGLTQLAGGDATSELPYAIAALGSGSVVNIGAPAGPNEKLYIAGKVLAHTAINLYSGTASDGIDVELDYTGVLATTDGSIAFNVGEFGDVKGSIIAGGEDSDVLLTAGSALVIRGQIEAGRHIELSTTSDGLAHTEFSTRMQQSAGITPVETFFLNNLLDGAYSADEQVSVYLDNTSSLAVTGTGSTDRHIYVTGNQDVIINGTLGENAGLLHDVKAQSVTGNLFVAQQSGRLQSDALLLLQGNNVVVDGVVRNTAATAAADDWEIDIDAINTVTITGDVSGDGSILVQAGSHVAIYNTDVTVEGSGELFKIDSAGTIKLGEVGVDFTDPLYPSGKLVNLGSVINAPGGVILESDGKTTISPAIVIAASGDDSLIDITAGELLLVGSIFGGATNDGSGPVWTGHSADVTINVAGPIQLGALLGGYAEDGTLEDRGGSIDASGVVTINTSAGGAEPAGHQQYYVRCDGGFPGWFGRTQSDRPQHRWRCLPGRHHQVGGQRFQRGDPHRRAADTQRHRQRQQQRDPIRRQRYERPGPIHLAAGSHDGSRQRFALHGLRRRPGARYLLRWDDPQGYGRGRVPDRSDHGRVPGQRRPGDRYARLRRRADSRQRGHD